MASEWVKIFVVFIFACGVASLVVMSQKPHGGKKRLQPVAYTECVKHEGVWDCQEVKR